MLFSIRLNRNDCSLLLSIMISVCCGCIAELFIRLLSGSGICILDSHFSYFSFLAFAIHLPFIIHYLIFSVTSVNTANMIPTIQKRVTILGSG